MSTSLDFAAESRFELWAEPCADKVGVNVGKGLQFRHLGSGVGICVVGVGVGCKVGDSVGVVGESDLKYVGRPLGGPVLRSVGWPVGGPDLKFVGWPDGDVKVKYVGWPDGNW